MPWFEVRYGRVELLSDNTCDRSGEASMTAAIVIGRSEAVIGFIARDWVWAAGNPSCDSQLVKLPPRDDEVPEAG